MHNRCRGLLQQQYGAKPIISLHTTGHGTCTLPAAVCTATFKPVASLGRQAVALRMLSTSAVPSSAELQTEAPCSSHAAQQQREPKSVTSPCSYEAEAHTNSSRQHRQTHNGTAVSDTISVQSTASVFGPDSQGSDGHRITRRALLSTCIAATVSTWSGGSPPASASVVQPTCRGVSETFLSQPVDYTGPGPLQVVYLPMKLETVCTACFNSCAGTSCLLRLTVLYPKGGSALGLGPPYPLAIFTAGFLIGSDFYRSYAERLTSWGYTCLLYDKLETAVDALDDVTSVRALRQIMDWAGSDPLIRRVADTSRIYLIGHSRGGKLSALAAIPEYERVRAVCLLDPVDNTVYAPLSDNYPSAVAALKAGRRLPMRRLGSSSWLATNSSTHQNIWPEPLGAAPQLPVAVVGSGVGSDCAPVDANYRRFHLANRGASWEVVIKEAGHFDYLDQVSPLQRALCPSGAVSDVTVRAVSQAVMVAWGELMVRQQPAAVLVPAIPSALAYPAACANSRDAITHHRQARYDRPAASLSQQTQANASSAAAGLFNRQAEQGEWVLQGGSQADGHDASASASSTREEVCNREDDSMCSNTRAQSMQLYLDRMLTGLRYQYDSVQLTSRYRNLDRLPAAF